MHGLKKAGFYAYKFFNELGEDEVQADDEACWVCRQGADVQALLWKLELYEQKDYNRDYFTKDLPWKNQEPARLHFTGLSAGRYTLSIHRVGHRTNDIYGEYLAMGAPANLSREQLATLRSKNTCAPELTKQITVNEDGVFTLDLEVRDNDAVLVKLSRVREDLGPA
jgi:xylan 1,4-beta-xylosidase